eukprot:m.89899 g.89899  ORF g.89899 m.89899 type:complete len:89 (-) comp13246_c0_seq4:711-977(-)
MIRTGKLYFIFQPAEEGLGGAKRMLEEGLFTEFCTDCEEIYGMHNWPQLPVGTFGIRSGPLMASCDDFFVTINGKGGMHELSNLFPIH